MPTNITRYNIFVASPSDVIEERNAIDDVIDELNQSFALEHNVIINTLKWEKDTYPSTGDDAQDVINKQIPTYDIFLCIMWSKIGTATLRDTSGTKEEFERAYRKSKEDGNVEIMVYFKTAAVPFDKIDPDQISAVREFQNHVKSQGVYFFTFEDTEQFKKFLRLHIPKAILNLISFTKPSQVVGSNVSEEIINTDFDEGIEPGILEDIVLIENSFNSVTEVLHNISDNVTAMGGEFTVATSEIEVNISQKKSENMKNIENIRIVNKVADKMLHFSEELEKDVALYKKYFETGFNTFSSNYRRASETDNKDSNWDEAVQSLVNLKTSLPDTVDSMVKFRDMVIGFPSLTKQLNRAKQRMVKAMNELISEFRFTGQLIDDFDRNGSAELL